jgi:hypothetical protein
MSNATDPQTGEVRLVGITQLTADAINAEALKAISKHGFWNTPAAPSMTNADRLVILVEELGECGRAMTYDEGDPTKLERELIQVAAMAAMWIDGLNPHSRRAEELAASRETATPTPPPTVASVARDAYVDRPAQAAAGPPAPGAGPEVGAASSEPLRAAEADGHA